MSVKLMGSCISFFFSCTTLFSVQHVVLLGLLVLEFWDLYQGVLRLAIPMVMMSTSIPRNLMQLI